MRAEHTDADTAYDECGTGIHAKQKKPLSLGFCDFFAFIKLSDKLGADRKSADKGKKDDGTGTTRQSENKIYKTGKQSVKLCGNIALHKEA